MKKIFLIVLLASAVSMSGLAGSRGNPFQKYNDKIKSLEKAINSASEHKKKKLEADLAKLKNAREKQARYLKKPYEREISKLEKKLKRAKGSTKIKIQKKLHYYKRKVSVIDKYLSK